MWAFWQIAGEKSLVPRCFEIGGSLHEFSKGILQNDIWEFEFSHPSHAVWSRLISAS